MTHSTHAAEGNLGVNWDARDHSRPAAVDAKLHLNCYKCHGGHLGDCFFLFEENYTYWLSYMNNCTIGKYIYLARGGLSKVHECSDFTPVLSKFNHNFCISSVLHKTH